MYNYWQILQQSFKVAWRHPGLWFFGFFVALLGSSGETELFLGSYGFGGNQVLLSFWQGLADGGLFSKAGLLGLSKIIFSHPFILFSAALAALVVLALTILIVWLIIVSQAALISQIINVVKNKRTHWRQGFDLGLTKFWPILGLNVILRVILSALLWLSAVVTIFKFPIPVLILVLILDVCFIFILLLSFMAKYAVCGIALKNLSLLESIKFSWKLFKKNWLVSLEIAIILFAIYATVNSIAFWLFWSIAFNSFKLFAGFTFGLFLILILLLSSFVLIQIFLTIFHWATWAIVFELLTTPKKVLVSVVENVFRR